MVESKKIGTFMYLLFFHSKKLRLDPDLFRPLFYKFLYFLVCTKAPTCYFSKFESNFLKFDMRYHIENKNVLPKKNDDGRNDETKNTGILSILRER